MREELVDAQRVRSIIGAFYTVYNYFGYGLAETVHAGALESELMSLGHGVVRELAISVTYKGRHVAWQRLDMVMDERVVIECKAASALPPYADRQILNYLRASSYQVGLLLHFGQTPEFKRFVDTKKSRPAIQTAVAGPD